MFQDEQKAFDRKFDTSNAEKFFGFLAGLAVVIVANCII